MRAGPQLRVDATRCALKERRLPAAGGRPDAAGAWKAPLRRAPTRGLNSEMHSRDWGGPTSNGRETFGHDGPPDGHFPFANTDVAPITQSSFP